MNKSGKESRRKGTGRKTTAGARPAKPGKAPSATGTAGRPERDRWRELVETSAAWIWETDADIRHTYTNAFVTRCLGYEPAEFLRLDTLDLVHPDDRGLVKKLVQTAITRKEGWFNQILRWRHKDGTWRYIESSGSALFDAQGTFAGLCGIDRDITEQKQAVEDLRRSEEKYRDLFENAIDAICIVDRNQNYLDVNRRAIGLFGYSREELLSMNIRDILPPGQITRSEEEFAKLTESGAYEKFTGQARRKDGSYIDIEVSSSAIVEQGQVIGSRDIIRDITERKRSEEALRTSEAALRDAQNVARIGSWRYRVRDHQLWWSDELYRIFGMDPGGEPLSLERIFARVHADDREVFKAQVVKHEPHRTDYRIMMPDGFVKYIHEEVRVECDATGRTVRMYGTAQDVTERKRIEEALQASRSRYQAIVDTQAEFVVRYQPGGIITFVNDTLCRYTHMKRTDLLGRSYYPFMHPDDRDAFIRKIEALSRENPAMVAEARVVLPDGRESWHQWTHHAIFNDRGDLVEYQCTGRDVTELKQAEARLSESEKKYRTLFESSNDGIFILDLHGNFIDVNPAAYTRLGYLREELLSLNIRMLDTPEYADKVPGRLKQLREQGTAVFESALRRKDGSVMQIEVSARLLEYEGKPALVSVNRDITERKRAEEELRASEERFRLFMDNSPTIAWLKDEQGRHVYLSKTYEDRFGVRLEDWRGKTDAELWPREFAEMYRLNDLAALTLDHPITVTEETPSPDGSLRSWLNSKFPFRDASGNRYVGGIGLDVTERKRAEEALRKSEKMLQTIIDAEPECVKLLDENACLIMMNRAGLDMLQVESLDQVKGRCICPMVASAYQQEFLGLTKRVFQGESGILLFEMVGMKGRHLWLETHAVPLRNEKDEIIALLGVTRDVTERKRAEEALRQSEARFRAIIESSSVGILVTDVETRMFRYANPEICRLLGYSEQDFFSLTTRDLIAPEELHESAAGFQAHAEGTLNLTERTFRRKDGSTIRMSINSVRMDFDGRLCLVGFFTDITEKMLLEEERLKAQKLESIGTLAGGIAHDFNNLLQGVFGYISMAKLTIDQREKSLAMLVQAEKALHQSVNLTSQLLTFSKGGKPLRKTVDLKPVIENAVKFALSGSRVNYDLSQSDDLSMVEADAGQIGQVVQNIVMNAEQSMPLGGRIEIAARNVPQSQASGLPLAAPDGLVEIVVRDQGMGIPPEHLPRIFDPYFTTKEKGSGLGLATSYSIVKNHDGMIEVSSELGKGSTFTVYLPATRAARESTASSAAAEPAAGKKGRILVMDDEPLVRVVAAELLRALGHEAEFAEHGSEAVEKYKQAKAEGKPFDIVILDLTIRGGKGGAETVRELLAIDPGVKAVVSSGYSDDEIVATFREHGFCSFLKKPYDMQDLAKVLADVMA
jgi:PAS domain S-box-containing protein